MSSATDFLLPESNFFNFESLSQQVLTNSKMDNQQGICTWGRPLFIMVDTMWSSSVVAFFTHWIALG